MADLDWTQLLPFGVVLFGVTALGFTRRRAGRALARRDYPKLAGKLGLELHAADGQVGTLTGSMEGVRVRVESDERARLVCYPVSDIGLDVRNYAHHKRTPAGYETISLGNRVDDRWALNRFAREGVDSERSRAALRALVARLGSERERVKTFTVDAEKIECLFDFGVPAYLPAGVVERLLPAMVALARAAGERGGESTAAE